MLFLFFGIPRPALSRPALDPQGQGRLARYEVLLFSESAGVGLLRHRAVGLFDAQPEDIFHVVTCYEQYSEYLPRIASHVISQQDDWALVMMEAELPWPMSNVWVYARYVHDSPYQQAYRVRFVMLRGNMRRYEGSLLIEPYGDGRTTVTYELLAEPNSRLPRSWVQRAFGRGASNYVHFLRSRVTQLRRLDPGATCRAPQAPGR